MKESQAQMMEEIKRKVGKRLAGKLKVEKVKAVVRIQTEVEEVIKKVLQRMIDNIVVATTTANIMTTDHTEIEITDPPAITSMIDLKRTEAGLDMTDILTEIEIRTVIMVRTGITMTTGIITIEIAMMTEDTDITTTDMVTMTIGMVTLTTGMATMTTDLQDAIGEVMECIEVDIEIIDSLYQNVSQDLRRI
ncbi:uncharacterized protein LOC134247079 [Saccostrea cucullata]|uniref:uncharacterized protein LOC134247079 n=1 Tax=Saccostrea cuccullata TaxID=36930 RepID=UPI002ECFE7EF